jgi:hypothetical protein
MNAGALLEREASHLFTLLGRAPVSTRRIAHATESGFDPLDEVPARPDNIRTPFFERLTGRAK